jgi:hypothetical protein
VADAVEGQADVLIRAAAIPRPGQNGAVYQSDANLVVPADDTPLWRYLDFARFMALLDSASLWFARADTFSDQYELAVPSADMAAARSGAAGILADGRTRDGVVRYLAAVADRPAGELAGLPDSEIAGLLLRFAGRALYISCWQEDQDESAGMWDSFVQGDNGVAVVTTVGAFRDVLDAGSGKRDVFLGRVAYLDYRAGSWGAFHPFAPAFHKRRLFRQEQEVRAAMVWPSYRDLADGITGVPTAAGIAVPVDLSALIQGIVIAPRASSWLPGLVSSILHRYGLSTVPVSSELSREPDW